MGLLEWAIRRDPSDLAWLIFCFPYGAIYGFVGGIISGLIFFVDNIVRVDHARLRQRRIALTVVLTIFAFLITILTNAVLESVDFRDILEYSNFLEWFLPAMAIYAILYGTQIQKWYLWCDNPTV